MTKKEQLKLCIRLKALYTKMDKLQEKHGFMAKIIWDDLKESQEIEAKLDKAVTGVRWYSIFLAWEHGWKWSPYNPGPKPKPAKGRRKELDEKQVKSERTKGKSLAQIAEKFGVTRGAVQAALKR